MVVQLEPLKKDQKVDVLDNEEDQDVPDPVFPISLNPVAESFRGNDFGDGDNQIQPGKFTRDKMHGIMCSNRFRQK